ncbi:MAG: MurNAc alpha-1-phosphate uridylyltransferase [Gammaproteobacteria bacterium]|jgi:MurNAc alpha-1-phosphate uridylyltransferase
MNAMILAAGRGKRLRPVTDTCPKPLLDVKGKPLISYHFEALAKAGIKQVIVNVSWLGGKIEEAMGSGRQFGLEIVYSRETRALETAGGIVHALEKLDDRFIVVNGDILTDYPFERLLSNNSIAHLVMVKNPPHHPNGDFGLNGSYVTNKPERRYTFAGISCFHKSFFEDLDCGKQALAPLLRKAIEIQQVTGELYEGPWLDVGTLERWESIG